ncbi:ABC transporter ATP-binding protein [Alicyclobacillaceae bacterium I2511]|nr:ABC transporter ATP-binding protein [Alicyclobacillaceae bacterium I2511]
MSHNLLTVTGLTKSFGGLKVLAGISFTVAPGEILGLVGPNGSGKTTCINVISGLYKPDGGQVIFKGQSVTGKPLHVMAKAGVNRTFQIPKPFKGLTVKQNIEVVQHRQGAFQVVDNPLEFVGLQKFQDRDASSLTSGQQKLLDLARALASGPEMLLVDELAAGLNPAELVEIARRLKHLSERGVALLVVEHLLGFVNELTQRVIVMNAGKEIFEGDLDSAAKNERVVEVYLGQ